MNIEREKTKNHKLLYMFEILNSIIAVHVEIYKLTPQVNDDFYISVMVNKILKPIMNCIYSL